MEWNYRNLTPFATGPCAELRGTTGEIFNNPVVEDVLEIFSPEMCKYIALEYVEDAEMDGLMCRKYKLGLSSLDNGKTNFQTLIKNKFICFLGTLYENKKCFCENHYCVPTGATDISRCSFGMPAIVSKPHFYEADPYYLQNIEGLNPQKDKHEFGVYIDPVSSF